MSDMVHFEGRSSPTQKKISAEGSGSGDIKPVNGSLQNVGTTQEIIGTRRRSFMSKRASNHTNEHSSLNQD